MLSHMWDVVEAAHGNTEKPRLKFVFVLAVCQFKHGTQIKFVFVLAVYWIRTGTPIRRFSHNKIVWKYRELNSMFSFCFCLCGLLVQSKSIAPIYVEHFRKTSESDQKRFCLGKDTIKCLIAKIKMETNRNTLVRFEK